MQEATLLGAVPDGGIGRILDQGHGQRSGHHGENRPPGRGPWRKPHRGAVSIEPHPRVENFEGRAGDRAESVSAHGAVDPRPGQGLRGSQGPGGGTPGLRLLRLGFGDGDVCRMPKILYADSFRAFTYDSSHGEVRPSKGRGKEKCREHSIRRGENGRTRQKSPPPLGWQLLGALWAGSPALAGQTKSSGVMELVELVHTRAPGALPEMTQRYSGDLESLFLAGHKLMEEMLPFRKPVKTCWKPKSWGAPRTASLANGSCATQWSTPWRVAIVGL